MADTTQTYPFDPTGSQVTNKIADEAHNLVPPSWSEYHFIIPKAAPYFLDSMKIVLVETGQELVEGVDWLASHKFLDASRATAKLIYGSITFLNKELAGLVAITYQTLGGDWLVDDLTMANTLANKLANPRVTSWEFIANPPYQFPVIDHEWNLKDMVGLSSVLQAMDTIRQTLEDRPNVANLLQTHMGDFDNPHKVTKTQVGLSNVQNYSMADRNIAEGGMREDRYMSPLAVKYAIDRFAITSDNTYYTKEEMDAIIAQLRAEFSK